MTETTSVVFLISLYTLFSWFLKKSKDYNSGLKKFFFFFLAIVIPCYVVSIRYGVGTDYFTYLAMYRRQENISLLEYLRNFDLNNDTIGIYVVSQIALKFNSPEMFFFLLAVGTYFPVAYFLTSQKELNVPVFLSSFYYLSIQFTVGLNIIKQTVAIAFICLSIKYVLEKKKLRYIICILLACCFHFTAIITIPIYFIFNKNNKDNSEKQLSLKKRLLFVVIYAMICYYIPIILTRIGGRFEAYNDSLSSDLNKSFFLILMWGIILSLMTSRLKEVNYENSHFVFLIIIGIIFESTGFYSIYVKRISMYFTTFLYILIPQIPLIFQGKSRLLVKILIYIYIIFYFIIMFGILKQSGVIPFTFLER